ncbi:transmembrane protein, putative [Medicago truncatula]|uniref:Transmembrane protein, putative n=1 Tax=Medicago truncatula TaxID=3880 RepID=A0A072VJ85_MEDTR|nr:transmembrane protein, putative [Medicago truncatula]
MDYGICITTTSTSIPVNGSPTDEFQFERRLRQGESFSPFLFLITAEVLNVMMNALVNVCFFFNYQVASGLKVSFHKSMLVDGNVLNSWLNKDSIVMNSKIGHLLFMYLGLPIGGCGDGGEAWKCCRRLLAWEEELGRECCELLLPIVLHADMNERWI